MPGALAAGLDGAFRCCYIRRRRSFHCPSYRYMRP